MTRTQHASATLSFIAPLALLAFSGCGSRGVDDSSATDPVDVNAMPSNAAPASAMPSYAPDTTQYYVNAPSDTGASDTGASDTGASDTGASDTGTGQLEQGLASAPSLGAAEGFSVLASSTVTCANSSTVTGDVGVSPGIEITGFDASCTLSGALHAKDPAADAAHQDVLGAFDTLASEPCETNLSGVELGGLTLSPGVYCFDTTAGVTGDLTLDAGGDPNAVWIFQVGSAITTATGSTVAMIGGGNACNVFWQVGSSAALGTNSAFSGNLLASASITLVSGSSLVGRALALNAAVTSDANAISGCAR